MIGAYLEMNSRSVPELGDGEEAMAGGGSGGAILLITNEAECIIWTQIVCEERGDCYPVSVT
jgi:hypothetical protein